MQLIKQSSAVGKVAPRERERAEEAQIIHRIGLLLAAIRIVLGNSLLFQVSHVQSRLGRITVFLYTEYDVASILNIECRTQQKKLYKTSTKIVKRSIKRQQLNETSTLGAGRY